MEDVETARRLTVLQRARSVIAEWAVQSQSASPSQVSRILKLLNPKHLLQRRVNSRIRRVNTPEGLRFLFYHHTAHILGWRERRSEGHDLGFSAAMYNVLRDQLWPDPMEHGRRAEPEQYQATSARAIEGPSDAEAPTDIATPSRTRSGRAYSRHDFGGEQRTSTHEEASKASTDAVSPKTSVGECQ